jgi:hypothetical protein
LTLKVDTFSVQGTDGGGFGGETEAYQALGTTLPARENDRTDTAFRRGFCDGTIVDGCKNIATFHPTCASRTRKQIVMLEEIATLEELGSLGTANSKGDSEDDLYPVQPTS